MTSILEHIDTIDWIFISVLVIVILFMLTRISASIKKIGPVEFTGGADSGLAEKLNNLGAGLVKLEARFQCFNDGLNTLKAVVEVSIKDRQDLHESVDKLLKSDGEQMLKIKYFSLDILRLTIYNEAVNIADRLSAYRRYSESGGNGETREYAEGLIARNKDVWETIQRLSAAYRKGGE